MSRFKRARHRTLLTLLATLLSVPAVVAGATSASADPACTGRIEVLASSRFNAYVGVFFVHRRNDAITRGQTRGGTAADPVVRYSTPLDRAFQVVYHDLHWPYDRLRTDTLDRGGTFNINPCHWAKVHIY